MVQPVCIDYLKNGVLGSFTSSDASMITSLAKYLVAPRRQDTNIPDTHEK